MQINMTTFARRQCQYVVTTLGSLFVSDWQDADGALNLILGSEDDSHVRWVAGRPRVRLVAWNQESNEALRINCTLNKIRALRHGDDVPTLVCEDDIVFRRDWLATLRTATAELGDEDYVLSLFAAAPELEQADRVEGKTWIKHYPTHVLQGAQAIYYPTRAIRDKVADYLTENLTSACGDELIGRCAREQAALYATREVLVDHVGAVSCFHQSREA